MAAQAAFALDYYYNFDCDQLLYCQICGWSIEDYQIWREEKEATKSGAWLVRALCPMRRVAVSRCGLAVWSFTRS
jgi:hypothetical protein